MTRLIQIGAGSAAALVLFLAGRLAGGAFSAKEETSLSKADHHQVSAILPKAIDHRGVSMFVAEREGYSQDARDLLALFDGPEFVVALAALPPGELERLVEDLGEMELSPKMGRMVDAVFDRWVEIDPRRSVEITLGAEDGAYADYRLRLKALQGLTRIDPEEALRMALAMNDERQAPHLAGEVLEIYARIDPVAAASFLLERDSFSLESHADAHLAAYLVQNWAKTSPTAAAAFIGRLPKTMRPLAAETLAKIWAKSDAPAAYRWLNAQSEIKDAAMKEMLKSFVTTASTSDPNFVIDLINSEEGYGVREHALEKLAQHYAHTQPAAAIEWLGTLEDYDDRVKAARGTITALPPGDAEGFSKVLASVPPAAKGQAIIEFVWRWAEHQPEQAIQWARNQTDLRTQYSAIEGLTDALTSSDEGGTHHAEIAEIIDTKPDFQRIWARYLSDSWAVVDPAGAFDWAKSVASPTQREMAIKEVLEHWRRRDPGAARGAVEAAAGLPEDLRGRLLEQLPEA